MRIIPLFKSHYSIGKSILTLDDKNASEDGADSIFGIAKEAGLSEVFLVEDCMTSFMKADKLSNSLGIKLRFGFRFGCFSNPELPQETGHKIVIFAKNTNGVKTLYKIHKEVFRGEAGILDSDLCKLINQDVNVVIPFYDSFVANNTLFMKKCVPNLPKGADVFFFAEDNNLPFDKLLREAVQAASNGKPVVYTKSIYYKNKKDYEALQTYKLICNRKFGKQATLDSPNLDHFASYDFCWESYLEQCKKNS
jgi:DNA polymerase III alpha subunit